MAPRTKGSPRYRAKTVRVKAHPRKVVRRINVSRGNLSKVKTKIRQYYRRPA